MSIDKMITDKTVIPDNKMYYPFDWRPQHVIIVTLTFISRGFISDLKRKQQSDMAVKNYEYI